MNLELITVSVLLVTSGSLCIAMLVAWLYLGRQPYALMWAIAAGGAALQWVIAIVAHAAFPEALLPHILTGQLTVIDSSLIALAFRHRAGLPLRTGWFVAGNLVAFAVLVFAIVVRDDQGLRTFVANIAPAALFLLTVPVLLKRGRGKPPLEFGLAAVLLLFALFECAVAVLALYIGTDGLVPAAITYRALLGIGLPACYVALGLAAVMLLVSDLAGKLEALTTRDPLTGAFNRRGIEQAGVAQLADARRLRLPLSVVVVELRGWRAISQRIGRSAADRLLTLAADQLNAAIREDDLFARLDRTRFCLVLCDTRLPEALGVARQVEADIAALDHGFPALPPLAITCGVAQLKRDDFAFGSLLKRAEAGIEDEWIDGQSIGGGARFARSAA